MNLTAPSRKLGEAGEVAVAALAMNGDDAAFSELVRRRQNATRQLLRRLTRDPALADDLAQQSFVQAWKAIRTLKSPSAFGAWLRKLAVNCWLQHARVKPREVSVPPGIRWMRSSAFPCRAMATPSQVRLHAALHERMRRRGPLRPNARFLWIPTGWTMGRPAG